MYPMTRESVMAAISSSVAEKAVCWCDGRKKRSRRILRRLTHLAVGGRVIGGLESGMGLAFPSLFSVVQAFDCQPQRTQSYTGETQGKSKSLQLSANSTARPKAGAAAAPDEH